MKEILVRIMGLGLGLGLGLGQRLRTRMMAVRGLPSLLSLPSLLLQWPLLLPFLLLSILAIPSPVRAQVSNPVIIAVTSAPSGSCNQTFPDQQVVYLGTVYTCQQGTWAELGSLPANLSVVATNSSGAAGQATSAGIAAAIGVDGTTIANNNGALRVKTSALAQNFSGNKLGSNPTLEIAADNGQSERHFFDLRNTSDWDAEGGLTPTFSFGQWHSSGAGASKMVRAFNFGFAQPTYTIQGILQFSSSGVANFIGVTPAGTAAGTVASTSYAVGFYGGNFVYFNGSAFTTLLAGTSLTAGNFYAVTLVGVNNLADTCTTGLASITPLGQTLASTFILSGCLPNSNNFQVESDSVYDVQFGLRYAAGNNPVPSTNTSAGPGHYGQIDVPVAPTTYGLAWPVQTTVASNPTGSQVNTYAIVPPTYSYQAQTPWVLYLHGDGQYGSAIFGGNDNTLIQALAYAGYLVVSTDYTSITCWGNPACTQDVASVIANYQAYFNLAPHPYVIEESMGGLVSLNSVFHGTLTPRAVVGLYPVFSLASLYDNGSGTYASQIQTAYNFSSPSGYAAATAGYDPALDPIGTFVNIPFDIWCSSSDTVVSCANNGQALVNAINAAGGSATYNASSGNHGDPSNFDPAAVVSFFNAN